MPVEQRRLYERTRVLQHANTPRAQAATFLISSVSLSPSTFCLDSRTVCTLRFRCRRRLLSRFLCFMCSLRRASIRFSSACNSD